MAESIAGVCTLLVLVTVFQSTHTQTTQAAGTPGGSCSSTGSPNCPNPLHVCHENTCVPFVGLGGACSVIDVCHHAADKTLRLACVSNRCLIQRGQTCADNRNKCVTGAECDASSLCRCAQGHVDWDRNQTLLCRRETKIGLDCSDGARCVSSNGTLQLTCDPYVATCVLMEGESCDNETSIFCPSGSACERSVCTCIAPFYSDKGACRKTVSTVGAVCSPADTCQNDTLDLTMDCDRYSARCLIEAGQPCQRFRDQCTNGAICSNTTNTCVCSTNFTTSDSGKTCQGPQGSVGGRCNTGNTCDDTAAICNEGYCLCKQGFNFIATNSSCVPGGSQEDGGIVNDGKNGGTAGSCQKTAPLGMLLFTALFCGILLLGT